MIAEERCKLLKAFKGEILDLCDKYKELGLTGEDCEFIAEDMVAEGDFIS